MAAARARAKQKEQARQISAGDVLKPFEDPFMQKVTALQKAMEDSSLWMQLRAMEDSPLMKQIWALTDRNGSLVR
jgi:hypothetical protein